MEEDNISKYVILSHDVDRRLDVFLASVTTTLSRSHIQTLIEDNCIFVNEMPKKASYRLKKGDIVTIKIPEAKPLAIQSQDISLDIHYEDDDIIVINKPAGMVIHPACGHYEDTLVNALLHHCGENLSGIGGVKRPGIVHRLDKGTSGLLVVAKNDKAHLFLAEQLKNRKMIKKYICLVHGTVEKKEGVIELPIGRHPQDRKKMAVVKKEGRDALTFYSLKESFREFTLLEISLKTGRTHQIRVHLAYIGYPVVGDETYGRRWIVKYRGTDIEYLIKDLNGYALHSALLGFTHPARNEYMEFKVPLPEAFQNLLAYLREQHL